MRIKISIEYVGTHYVGWQKQKNGISVQEEIEKCLEILFKREISIFAAGRTDSGVHALNQVAHFDIEENIDLEKTKASINFFLKKKKNLISIIDLKKTNKKFHARFSAKKRTYLYRILNRRSYSPFLDKKCWFIPYEIDIESMKQASTFLIGYNDFNAFRSKYCQSKKSLRTIDEIRIKRIKSEITILISAKSFLHNQVRIIVGSLINVGRRYWEINRIEKILKTKDRSFAGPTAPPEGLYLKKILY